jgi:hypothetical protein
MRDTVEIRLLNKGASLSMGGVALFGQMLEKRKGDERVASGR